MCLRSCREQIEEKCDFPRKRERKVFKKLSNLMSEKNVLKDLTKGKIFFLLKTPYSLYITLFLSINLHIINLRMDYFDLFKGKEIISMKIK